MKKYPKTYRVLVGLFATMFAIVTAPVDAQGRDRRPPENEEARRKDAPVPRTRKRSERPPEEQAPREPARGRDVKFPSEFRSITGRSNNVAHPEWGAAEAVLLRLIEPEYADGSGAPGGSDRPGTRAISNAVAAQSDSVLNRRGASDYLWQWGQFVDHDIDETPTIDPPEPFHIPVPAGDRWFDPQGSGAVEIPLNRSFYEMMDGVRQQVNAISAYIDASNVYGSDEERAYALRTLDGSGKLKTTASDHGDLLPYNFSGLDNAPAPSPVFFLAGDVRANEQIALTAMHTLFVREHNHWAGRYAEMNSQATGEEIYQFARMIVAGEMQAITYREFLPVLLGREAIRPYEGYDPDVNAGIANIFSTAAYRLGHSLLSPTLLRVDATGQEIAAGHLSLADAFFDPSLIEDDGIDSLLRGLAAQRCQELDGLVVDDVRNFLFGPPGSGGFDLPALNMQRGRDHGLPSFARTCRELNLRPPRDFRDINPDPDVWGQLATVYDDVRQVDCWIGGLCEVPVPDSMVGPMIHRILVDQFTRLRDGDRFYYENYLPPALVDLVEDQTLARIIRRNTGIGEELPDDVFMAPGGREDAPRRPRPPGPRRR